MRLILRVVLAVMLALILDIAIDIIGCIYLIALGDPRILLGMIVIDMVIIIAAVCHTIISAHDKGIYLFK